MRVFRAGRERLLIKLLVVPGHGDDAVVGLHDRGLRVGPFWELGEQRLDQRLLDRLCHEIAVCLRPAARTAAEGHSPATADTRRRGDFELVEHVDHSYAMVRRYLEQNLDRDSSRERVLAPNSVRLVIIEVRRSRDLEYGHPAISANHVAEQVVSWFDLLRLVPPARAETRD